MRRSTRCDGLLRDNEQASERPAPEPAARRRQIAAHWRLCLRARLKNTVPTVAQCANSMETSHKKVPGTKCRYKIEWAPSVVRIGF